MKTPKPKKRGYNQWGELAKLAMELSGRKPSTVYAVLRRKVKSDPVQRAIEEARAILRARGSAA